MATIMSDDPNELLRQAQAGDSAMLGQLLEQYRRYLGLLARVQIGQRLQGKVDEMDVVQEVFLEAHRHFAGFRGMAEGQFTAWLRQILATVLSNLLRHYIGTQARDLRLEQDITHAIDQSSLALDRALFATESSPSQEASRREQAVLLADALGELPADYREVIVLRHLQGMTFQEVAQRMGRSVTSVEKLWLRGLARLRQAMGNRP
ncbi:MAG: sigma-70 family RNA polymerase sigma factor [Gemmataceae bacterium]